MNTSEFNKETFRIDLNVRTTELFQNKTYYLDVTFLA